MAVVLRYYEGLSGREIAAAMEVSVKGIERLLARARRALEVLLNGFLEK
jgi:DNA-directed RNA polymerase specialized sigma24 family protein